MINRRSLLLGAACSAAAAPLLTPVSVAAAPGDNRLVVIILRGGMDGLGVFAPYGDRDYGALRPSIALAPETGLIDLDGRFGMHGRLSQLKPLWDAGELAVAHAVSTPYRGKRSHFDGQDLLEAGVASVADVADGWMNRALASIPGAGAATALAVGRDDMLLMRGERAVRSWSPGARLGLADDERGLLRMIYADDPVFSEAAAMAERLSELGGGESETGMRRRVAQYAADRLRREARIAAFSISGWDSHASQPSSLKKPLSTLGDALTILKDGLGPEWSRTLVVAMTEFGRTARENGNRGTDHGTGGAAVLAGGAVRGGRVYADWPGLGDGDLQDGRDLKPTADVRLFPAWALSAMFGVSRAALERDVFPGLEMGDHAPFLA